MPTYSFFYDEAEHSRKINYKTISAANYYSRSKISRNRWLFEPKYRNNAELTYILSPCIAIY